jgi:hypothetical protein
LNGSVEADLAQMTIQQYAAVGAVIAIIIIVITAAIIVLRKLGGSVHWDPSNGKKRKIKVNRMNT